MVRGVTQTGYSSQTGEIPFSTSILLIGFSPNRAVLLMEQSRSVTFADSEYPESYSTPQGKERSKAAPQSLLHLQRREP